MHTQRRFIPWIAFLIILMLVLAACSMPSQPSQPVVQAATAAINSGAPVGNPPMVAVNTATLPVEDLTQVAVSIDFDSKQSSLPTPDPAEFTNFLQSFNSQATPTLAAGVPFIHYILPSAATPDKNNSAATWSDITSWQLLWKGNPVPYPFVLHTSDCGQPLSVGSFSTVITANKATNFSLIWAAFIMTWDASHTNIISQTVAGQGNQLNITFSGAGTQTINQDVPFMLNCGIDYTIVNAVGFANNTGGYPIMQALTISLNPTATVPFKVPTATATLKPLVTLPKLVTAKPTLKFILIPSATPTVKKVRFLNSPTPTPTQPPR